MRNKLIATALLLATVASPATAVAEPTIENYSDEQLVLGNVHTAVEIVKEPTKEEIAAKQIEENLKQIEEQKRLAEEAARAEAERIAAQRVAIVAAARVRRAAAVTADNSDAIAYGQARNAAVFGEAHWPALFQLWSNESGWRDTAINYRSGACGIPQFINGCILGDHVSQIDRGLVYIAQRYGNPTNALAFWNAHHWY